MTNPESDYQPTPSEIRSAENSMDERQRDLTEVREDSQYEGRRQEREAREGEDAMGYSKKDIDELKSYLKRAKGHSTHTYLKYCSEEINKSEATTRKILKDIGIETSDDKGRIDF
jgi:trimethylamine:corrinoid methyltransferase-like protein